MHKPVTGPGPATTDTRSVMLEIDQGNSSESLTEDIVRCPGSRIIQHFHYQGTQSKSLHD